MRILLIEDDLMIGDGIQVGLGRQGFAVDWFKEGTLGLEAVASAAYDAAVLDLTLPGLDGLNILQRWRKSGHDLPVLVLTARGGLEQRVEGLNLGADDYLGKPFALEELTARLRALIRRRHGRTSALLEHGSICLNSDKRSVSLNGQDIPMSPREIALVELFLLHRNSVLSKSAIEEKLYTWGEDISSNAVEVHVHHIRRKLGNAFIKTVHGAGYTLGEAP